MLSFFNERRGNISQIFALALVPIIILIGGSIDYRRAVNSELELQYALDATVLSAANLGADAYQSRYKRDFEINAVAIKAEEKTVDISVADGAKGKTFTGTATAKVPTYFSKMFGVGTIGVSVSSEVSLDKNVSGGPCIYIMDKQANYALRFNSGANISAPDCEVHVHSKTNWAANFNAGIDIDFKRICVAGSGTLNNYGEIESLELNCAAEADPYAGAIKEPADTSCDFNNLNFNGGTYDLSPGVYCGWVNFNSGTDIRLSPGLYVIKNGGWNVNGGEWTGDGVTFYFADTSKIQFNSAVAANLRPPTNGDYKNILIFEKKGISKSHFILDDSKDFDIEGVVHLPSRDTIYNSGSKVYSRRLTMVFNTLTLNNTRWTLTGADQTGSSSTVSEPRISK